MKGGEEESGQNPEGAKPKENALEVNRKKLAESERIEDLRDRLYARGTMHNREDRHAFFTPKTDGRIYDSLPTEDEVREEVKQVQSRKEDVLPSHRMQEDQYEDIHPSRLNEYAKETTTIPKNINDMKPVKRYRAKVVMVGVIFFVLALLVSSGFLFFGNNTISTENISLSVSGPFAIGGGSEIPFQVSISNQNTVPIESATLIVEYPPGTQSAEDPGKELFTVHQSLPNIDSGFVQNIPLKAIVFGEENDERIINVSIEYRVRGSNAILRKEAEPYRFKISSSPVVFTVDAVTSISSGQEIQFKLTVGSNSPTPLTDVLVRGTYPFGFEFIDSEPETSAGQDTWLIAKLDPGEKKTLIVRGIISGKQEEERIFSFSVGVSNENDRFNLASIYVSTPHNVAIEDPFLAVGVTINHRQDDTVAITSKEAASTRISFTNTLDDTLYDAVITAKLSGNALSDIAIEAHDGFYDSTTNMITWEYTAMPELKEVQPGRGHTVVFAMKPKPDISRTPEIHLEVTVRGKRVYENRVPQELVGTASRIVRVTSDVTVTSSAVYSEGPFTNSGPIPPVAETITQYTYFFSVKNGTNDLTGAELTATLPIYVTWLDLVTQDDTIIYNANNRTLTWKIGDIDANGYEEAWAQVSFLPSASQIGRMPIILETQHFKAIDRFTGTTLRSDLSALTTEILNDPDESTHDGSVRRTDE